VPCGSLTAHGELPAPRLLPPGPDGPADGRDRWRGVSHYASLEAALAKQRDFPWLGTSIAIVRIPAGAPVRIEQTGGDREHYTLWADPSLLRSYVVSVEAVERLH
jgi:hypothetical protein